MKQMRSGILSLLFLLILNVESHTQSAYLYDINLVGSLIDEGAVFPQRSGLEYGFLLRSGLKLNSKYQLQIDAGYAALEQDINVYLISLKNNFKFNSNILSPSIGYIDLNPFKSYLLGLDYVFHANDLLTITTGAFYEIKNIDQNQYYYDFSFIIYFTDQLMLRSGVAFTGSKLSRPLFEAILGFEYLPKSFPVSFFFELGNEFVFQNQFGIKFHFGKSSTLKVRHRRINMSSRFL